MSGGDEWGGSFEVHILAVGNKNAVLSQKYCCLEPKFGCHW